jgi:hypothetical protein
LHLQGQQGGLAPVGDPVAWIVEQLAERVQQHTQ